MNRFITIVLFLALLLAACRKEYDNSLLSEAKSSVILYHETNTQLDYNAVKKNVEAKVALFDFCKTFNITLYKTYKTTSYVVCKTTEGPFLVWFDSTGGCSSMEKIYFSSSDYLRNMAKLKVGMPVNEVQQADPSGYFPFIQASWGGVAQISYHGFDTGDYYQILYDDRVITEIFHITI